ncbi:MAG TPA: TetR/AcrR family transcriptional regulator [Acidimicrobiales bacterium]|nr:TetR/AcrR family transcriptional regulator [Acidimicrobiales bacterium]
MSPPRRSVKATRSYDTSGRRERAKRQREATLDTALALFLERGYAATTVEAIATVAGVSAATVYKTYGGKVGLIRSLCQRALEGGGPVPAETRSNALRTSSDPHDVVAGWGKLTTEVAPRSAPLVLMLRAAGASNAEAAALADEIDDARLTRMADNAHFLHTAGHLRPGVTLREARDVLWTCSSPELYDVLVQRRGWSLSRYGRFVTDTITNSLL